MADDLSASAGLRTWFNTAIKGGFMDASADPGLASVKQFVEVCADCLSNWLVLMRFEPESRAWIYTDKQDSQCPHCGGHPKEAL